MHKKIKIHSNQSVIPESVYKKINGSLNKDTIEKLKKLGKQNVLKKKQLKIQRTIYDYL